MMSNSPHPSVLDEAPKADWLHSAAAAIYTDRFTSPATSIPTTPREQWRQVSNLAGVTPTELAAAVARHFDLTDIIPGQPEKGLARLVPESLAIRHQMVPVALVDNHIVIAVSSPYCAAVIRDVAFAAGRQVEPRIAPPEAIESARLTLYSDMSSIKHAGLSSVLNLDEESAEFANGSGDKQLVQFCRALIRQAIDRRASDVHVHAFAGGGVARFRIDGQLQRVATITNLVLVSLVRLMKAQGGMDPSNSLIPQDGSASVVYKGKAFDLRISTLPSSGAEALVMRILDQSRAFNLEKTNFAPWALNTLRRLGSRESGLLLITGPTGSGKTSTLYALLAELNQPHRRIITVEDPIEYKLPGLTQVEVNNRAGLTFAKALRSILRQDPDVLLVGEIRDAETAEIAVQSALTGHLVFATMHTQDAIRAVTRLAELGVSTPLLADTILAVVSQRLLRQLCDHCKLPVTEPLSESERTFAELTGSPPSNRAQGCAKCNYTGFNGRFPVVEVVEMNGEMRAVMNEGVAHADALSKQLPPKWQSIEERAATWIEAGMTTVEEAVEGLGMRFWTRLAHVAGRGDDAFAITGSKSTARQSMPISVLVISNDADRGKVLIASLADVGYGAIVCADTDTALTSIRANKQLQHLLVDITDSGFSAGKLEANIRKIVVWSGLSVVLLHKADETPDAATLTHANAHAALAYPFAPNALRAAIENASVHAHVA